jgi:DNA invertase Pin-like site-specific DNA recombinase
VRLVLVETASRFARDLIVQETGWRFLQERGIELIAAESPEAFVADTPTAVLIRQILGAISQFEKASLVAKLKVARVRKRQQTGKCEGRKSSRAMAKQILRWLRMCATCALRAIRCSGLPILCRLRAS